MTDSKIVSIIEANELAELPDYLRAKEPSAMAGGLGGGARDRIGFKGNRFRLIKGGVELDARDENYLDVIVVTANPHVSRVYYKGKYDPNVKVAPDCFSSDGVTPFEGIEKPQSDKCNGCPQNIKGSAMTGDGKKSRACSFSKRLVVALDGDEDNTLYQVDLKALSIFGEGDPANKLYTLSGYSKLLSTRKVRVDGLVTRMTFDTDSSVPKLYFTPQGFLSEKKVKEVEKLSVSTEAIEMATVDMATVDLEGAHTEGTESAPPPAIEEKEETTYEVGSTVPAKKPAKKAKKTEEVKPKNDSELQDVLANLIPKE